MAEIECKWDLKDLAKIAHLEQKMQRKMNIAEKRAVKYGAKELDKNIRKKYNIKPEETKKEIKKRKGAVEITSRPLTIGTSTHFSHTPRNYTSQQGIPIKKRKRMDAIIKKRKKQKFEHAFIANPGKVKKIMMWKRSGKKIEPVRTVSIAQMASDEEIAEKTIKAMQKKMSEELEKLW